MAGLADGMASGPVQGAEGREDVLSSIRRLVAADDGARGQAGSADAAGVLRLGVPVASPAADDGESAPNSAVTPHSRAAALRAAMRGGEDGAAAQAADEGRPDAVRDARPTSPEVGGGTLVTGAGLAAADDDVSAALTADDALLRGGDAGGLAAMPAGRAGRTAADQSGAAAFAPPAGAVSGASLAAPPDAAAGEAGVDPIATLLGDMVREVIRQELQRESGHLAMDLRAILLNEVAQAITGAASRAARI